MVLYRYSAVEIQGVPVWDDADIASPGAVRSIMESYGVQPQEVGSETLIEDLVPPYWDQGDKAYRLLMTAVGVGRAVVEVVPLAEQIEFETTAKEGNLTIIDHQTVGTEELAAKVIRVPEDGNPFVVTGSSPLYPDWPCIHEAVIDLDEL